MLTGPFICQFKFKILTFKSKARHPWALCVSIEVVCSVCASSIIQAKVKPSEVYCCMSPLKVIVIQIIISFSACFLCIYGLPVFHQCHKLLFMELSVETSIHKYYFHSQSILKKYQLYVYSFSKNRSIIHEVHEQFQCS